jgi:hypothetical protein
MGYVTQEGAQLSVRRSTTAQLGGDTSREELMLFQIGVVIRHEGIVGVVRCRTRGKSRTKGTHDRDPVC